MKARPSTSNKKREREIATLFIAILSLLWRYGIKPKIRRSYAGTVVLLVSKLLKGQDRCFKGKSTGTPVA